MLERNSAGLIFAFVVNCYVHQTLAQTAPGTDVQNLQSPAGSITISINGTSIASEPALNFISGRGIMLSCANDAANHRVDCMHSLNTAIALTNPNVQANRPWFCNSTNGTTGYTCSLSAAAALTTYTTGMWLTLVVDKTNTGTPPTLNVDGVGVKTITQSDGVSVPTASQIMAGQAYWIFYDGAVFRLPPYTGVGICNATTFLRGDGRCATPNATAVGAALASATTITPTSLMQHVTGTNQISTITPLASFTASGMGGCIVLIPDGAWTTSTAGNIALASTATIHRAMTLCYESGTNKWYPSY